MSISTLLGKKIGTTQYFHEDGKASCVTAMQMGPCTITQIKNKDLEGYDSVQIGYEIAKN